VSLRTLYRESFSLSSDGTSEHCNYYLAPALEDTKSRRLRNFRPPSYVDTMRFSFRRSWIRDNNHGQPSVSRFNL